MKVTVTMALLGPIPFLVLVLLLLFSGYPLLLGNHYLAVLILVTSFFSCLWYTALFGGSPLIATGLVVVGERYEVAYQYRDTSGDTVALIYKSHSPVYKRLFAFSPRHYSFGEKLPNAFVVGKKQEGVWTIYAV